MKILAVDQARHGGWAIFDYDARALLDYGTWSFDNKTCSFEQAMLRITALIHEVIHAHGADAVFFEDIQLRRNVQSFKRLAQLQGALVLLCEQNEYQYGFVAPTQWQNFCKARGRTEKEIKSKIMAVDSKDKKTSKVLSLQFVKDRFGIETENDNLSDAICIGFYVVNQFEITKGEST